MGFIKKEISCHRIDGLAKRGQGKEEPSGSQGHDTVFVGAAGCSSHGRHSSAGPGDTLPLVLPQGIDATKRESRNHGMGWVGRGLEDDFYSKPRLLRGLQGLPCASVSPWEGESSNSRWFPAGPTQHCGMFLCFWGCAAPNCRGAALLGLLKQSPGGKNSFDRAVQDVNPPEKGIDARGIQPWSSPGSQSGPKATIHPQQLRTQGFNQQCVFSLPHHFAQVQFNLLGQRNGNEKSKASSLN